MEVYLTMERCFLEKENLELFAVHPNWRVRYAAAVAIGETRDPKWLPALKKILKREEDRSLYSQPPAIFTNTTDDTRMAEHIGPITAEFEHSYEPETLENWRCRGRVKQAVLFAINEIGAEDAELLDMLYQLIQRDSEDHPVKAAAARAIGTIGNQESIPYLEIALLIDEWCIQTEARKAIIRIKNGAIA